MHLKYDYIFTTYWYTIISEFSLFPFLSVCRKLLKVLYWSLENLTPYSLEDEDDIISLGFNPHSSADNA